MMEEGARIEAVRNFFDGGVSTVYRNIHKMEWRTLVEVVKNPSG